MPIGIAVLEQALRQAHAGLRFTGRAACLTPMPHRVPQLLRRELEFALVQGELGLRSAVHRSERLRGQHLRVRGERLQRFAAAFDIARRHRRLREQAQQLAAPLAQRPVRFRQRLLQAALRQLGPAGQ